MDSIEDRIENLKKQQEQAKEVFLKCQGAIEFLEGMIKETEEASKVKEDKKNKK